MRAREGEMEQSRERTRENTFTTEHRNKGHNSEHGNRGHNSHGTVAAIANTGITLHDCIGLLTVLPFVLVRYKCLL